MLDQRRSTESHGAAGIVVFGEIVPSPRRDPAQPIRPEVAQELSGFHAVVQTVQQIRGELLANPLMSEVSQHDLPGTKFDDLLLLWRYKRVNCSGN